MFILDVVDGALTDELPVWFEDASLNWLARLYDAPEVAGQIGREYAESDDRPGLTYRRPVWMRTGAAVEFGARENDTESSRSRRWFGVVTQATGVTVIVKPCATAAGAVWEAANLRNTLSAVTNLSDPDVDGDDLALLGAMDDTSPVLATLAAVEDHIADLEAGQVEPFLRLLAARWL
jgi:hypothetical protein